MIKLLTVIIVLFLSSSKVFSQEVPSRSGVDRDTSIGVLRNKIIKNQNKNKQSSYHRNDSIAVFSTEELENRNKFFINSISVKTDSINNKYSGPLKDRDYRASYLQSIKSGGSLTPMPSTQKDSVKIIKPKYN